jgi:hypothetical protein
MKRDPTPNRGVISLLRTDEPWRMSEEEACPSGAEYESFIDSLDAFLDGYFYSRGVYELPVHTAGDFYGERTEALHFSDGSALTEDLLTALQRWLRAPRRQNWRIVIPQKAIDGGDVVIYAKKILNR